eukprot:3811847-Pyramimonas_sp.AAC.1
MEVAERALSARLAVVVVLSEGSLRDLGCRLALCTADTLPGQHVVLLHATESCRFPQYHEMPRDTTGSISKAFNSKAI